MPAMTPEEKLNFILNVLYHCPEFKPDYRKTAEEMGCVNANKAQIKFKKIIDDSGKYTLTGGKMVAIADGGSGGAGGEALPSTPKPKTAGRGRGRAKKTVTPDSNGDDDDKKDTVKPSAQKKRKTISVDVDKDED